MLFFSKKQEVGLEQICRIFYENIILNLNCVDAIDINALEDVILNRIMDEVDLDTLIFHDFNLKEALIKIDSNFVNIDSQKFNNEIVPLQFELYALAWLHQFCNESIYGYAKILHTNKKDSKFIEDVFKSIFSAVAQSVFTKNYLKEKGLDSIWEAMGSYNQAIDRSTIIFRTPEKAFDRVYLSKVNLSRANLFDLYHEKGFDDECVARVLNRLFSKDTWKRGITAGLLLFTFCDRLGFNKDFQPSKETHRIWFTKINNVYKKFRKSLSKVKIKL